MVKSFNWRNAITVGVENKFLSRFLTMIDALGGNGVIVDPLSDKEEREDLVASC